MGGRLDLIRFESAVFGGIEKVELLKKKGKKSCCSFFLSSSFSRSPSLVLRLSSFRFFFSCEFFYILHSVRTKTEMRQ